MAPLLVAGPRVKNAVIVNHVELQYQGIAYFSLQTLTFQTHSATRHFNFHRSNFGLLSPPGADSVYSGLAFGYSRIRC